jgi:beta-galactosidase
VAVDIVAPDADLAAYDLVIAPSLYVLTEETASNLERFVQAGGTLLVTPRTGVKDEDNAVVEGPLPGRLAHVCGVVVEDYDSLPAGASNVLTFADVEGAAGRVWCDILTPRGAEVIARYGHDFYAGQPAITVNAFGSGHAVYLGTVGNQVLNDALVERLLDLAGVSAGPQLPDGVEMSVRWHERAKLVFLLNHSDQEHVVTLADGDLEALLGGSDESGSWRLAPRGVLVLTNGSAGQP